MNNIGGTKGWFNSFGTVSMVRREKLQAAVVGEKNITELFVQ